MFQTNGGKDRKSVDDSTQALAQDEALQICNDCLPFVVVWVGQALEGELGWKKSIFWVYSIVAEDWDGRYHSHRMVKL